MSGSRRTTSRVPRLVGGDGHSPLVPALATGAGVRLGRHLFDSAELQAERDAAGGGPVAVGAIVDPATPEAALVVVVGSFHLLRLMRVTEMPPTVADPPEPP